MFQTPDCLHYKAVKSSYQPHESNRVFTTSQKYIFNVHQITTSGGKFNSFLARTRTQNIAQNATKHTIKSSEKFIFGRKPSPSLDPISQWGKVFLTTLHLSPPPSLLDPPVRFPQNSSQIYATGAGGSWNPTRHAHPPTPHEHALVHPATVRMAVRPCPDNTVVEMIDN